MKFRKNAVSYDNKPGAMGTKERMKQRFSNQFNASEDLQVKQEGQVIMPSVDPYYDYPRDQIFEVAACGFACVMMRMDVLKTMGIYGGVPFFPVAGLGEDLAFCWRAAKMGITFHCDSRLKIGHIMRLSVEEGFRDKLLEGQQI